MNRRSPPAGVLALLLAAAPAVQDAAAARRPGPAAAGEGWVRADTRHLTIFSDASGERALEIGRGLERYRGLLAAIASDLRVHSPLPTFVYAFRDDASFRPYKPRQPAPAGSPLDLAGYFVKHRDGNFIGVNADPRTDPWPTVYHEYFHYFLNNNFSDIPLWFGEGMAEAFSTVRFKEGRVSVGRPLPRHLRWLRSNPLIPLEDLFAIDTASRDYNEGTRQGTFYAQSWALVHYLLWGRPGVPGTGIDFLRGLKRGSSLAAALRPLLGTDLGALRSGLEAYIGERLSHTDLEHEAPPAGDDGRVVPIDRAEALYRLGDFLLHVDPARVAKAADHFLEALGLDPRHAGAHAGLAQARAQQRRFDEAFDGFETALRLDPADGRIPLQYAYALLDRAIPHGVSRSRLSDDPPPELARARELFRRSARSAPDLGEAWAGLGHTYAFGLRDLAPGIEALEKARRLLPARDDIVLNLATLYARSGARDRARELVDGILRRSADPEIRAAGEEVLFRGDLEAAVALAESGRVGDGIRALRALRDATHHPTLREEADARLRALEDVAAKNREIELYNQAVERANQQDFPGASALLERFLERVSDPALRADAEDLLKRIRGISLYNRAVERANAGDREGAAALLRQILRAPPDAAMADRARALLAQIEGRAPPR
jgi:tetratricopeptide (TPR) repeat protein